MKHAPCRYFAKMHPAFHPPAPTEIEIKMSASILGCDPVEFNRTVNKSAVYSRHFHNFTLQKTPKTTVELRPNRLRKKSFEQASSVKAVKGFVLREKRRPSDEG